MQTNLLSSNLSEIKVSYACKVRCADRQKISSSADAVEAFRAIWSQSIELREECYLLLLNRANQVLGWFRVSEGGVAGTILDPRLIFGVALKCNAVGVILAHNHPSGNLKPSGADLSQTKRLVEGGKILEISFLDHLILTSEGYYSFADEGAM